MKNGFVIAGTNSGCGKTTITIGLMRLLWKSGHLVAPFKTGPDYIDPAFHTLASGEYSQNLDSYLLEPDALKQLFHTYTTVSDVAVVEGVMGMFDGLGEQALGSTAELAKKMDLPVVLVVNCKALYQSVAAIVNGFVHFDASVKIAGVILNHVYSDKQFSFLKQYIEQHCGVECFGYLPPDPEIALESRHLGLIQAGEIDLLNEKIDKVAGLLQQHCDIDALLKKTTLSPRKRIKTQENRKPATGLRIAVARDRAFSFYYEANLDLLITDGAELCYFSPMRDSKIPDDANAIYLGGGYPEVFAEQLSNNQPMLESIRNAIENNMPVYAECGGLMYLTEGISTADGNFYPMCGVFNCRTQMTARLQNFGYCTLKWAGVSTRAHEFHHSHLVENETRNYSYEFEISKTEIVQEWKGGLRYKNVLAGYPHIHFYADKAFYAQLIQLWKGER